MQSAKTFNNSGSRQNHYEKIVFPTTYFLQLAFDLQVTKKKLPALQHWFPAFIQRNP
jgi:hypothetical protein